MDQIIVAIAAVAFVLLTVPAVIVPLLGSRPAHVDTRTTVRHLTPRQTPQPTGSHDLPRAA